MIVTVFRSRLNPDAQNDYMQMGARMRELVKDIPGYISHKGFVAQDGERVTIIEFADEKGLRDWATHPEHVEAQKKGREMFFSEYRIQVCSVQRDGFFEKNF